MPLLSQWQNFYMIIGTAAATLTGLMFVVTTLLAGLDGRVEIMNAGTAAFNTPIVVHFCAVLLTAGILSAPWPSFLSLAWLLGLLGFAMIFYMLVVVRRMQRMGHYQNSFTDWLWYTVFPLIAYAGLIVAAVILQGNPTLALYVISAAMLTLLFAAVRNAWDLVTFFAIERSHHVPDEKDVSIQTNVKKRRPRS